MPARENASLLIGAVAITRTNERRARPRRGAREREQTLGALSHLRPGDIRLATTHAGVRLLPGLPDAHARFGDERGEVSVPGFGAREKGGGAAIHIQFRTCDHLHTAQLRDERGAYDATQIGGVGDANRGVAEVGRAIDHRLGCDGTIAEGEGGVGAEFDGGEGHEVLNSVIIVYRINTETQSERKALRLTCNTLHAIYMP